MTAIRVPDSHAIPGEHRLALMSLFGMKLEPLMDLRSGEVHGYEMLSQLPEGESSEIFFSVLSATAMVELFQLQVCLSHGMTTRPCFLNLPVRVLMNDGLCQYLACRNLRNVRIEIQDTEQLADISLTQRKALRDNLCRVIQAGAEVWADDVSPERIPLLQRMWLPLSGVKLSRYDFQRCSHDITSLGAVIRALKQLAPLVVVEGVETPEQYLIATLAEATYGQGYLWPAEVHLFH
ncbi:EAL domain-containing protein [Yokenella regensburgei]|uniref:EAL domain-containing protein n=1 Tax=Yokenella regensburgei TaxID=158877 RepID=UPI001432AA03|nr:EAL domain-containing protein [Yokenella regensburgei]QIU92560.1 EAL domain-containing protein [Yokenella regensburgei]